MATTHLTQRRFFLKSAGSLLALPLMESLTGRALGTGLALVGQAGAAVKTQRPQRMVCVGNLLGFHPPTFWPSGQGVDHLSSELLRPLAAHRKDLTVLAGLDHGHKGGHFAVHSFLSGVLTMDAKGRQDGNITLDQRAAETIGGATRFDSLTVGSEDGLHGGCLMSWTRSGTRVPPIAGPRELFQKLFVADASADKAQAQDRLALQGSILDAVQADAHGLKKHLGKRDQDKLEEYFSSVRDVERQLQQTKRWADVPKPSVPLKEPQNTNMVQDLPLLYDLMALALQTDSTRIATLEIAGGFAASDLDIKKDYHALSHHGQVEENIRQLVVIEKYQMEQFARFLGKLKSTQDGDATLLDHTMVLFGSGMANANAHTNLNLPILLAGGGFKHGQLRQYENKGLQRQPLCNLYVSMLQRFGLELESFGTSTSTLTGLS
jgi:hypothetical protein